MPMPNDLSWESGPPKSDLEQWRYTRRTELANITIALLRGEGLEVRFDVARASPAEREDDMERVERAVSMAQGIVTVCERRIPRL